MFGIEGHNLAQCKRARGSFIQYELTSLYSFCDPGVPGKFNNCKDMVSPLPLASPLSEKQSVSQ